MNQLTWPLIVASLALSTLSCVVSWQIVSAAPWPAPTAPVAALEYVRADLTQARAEHADLLLRWSKLTRPKARRRSLSEEGPAMVSDNIERLGRVETQLAFLHDATALRCRLLWNGGGHLHDELFSAHFLRTVLQDPQSSVTDRAKALAALAWLPAGRLLMLDLKPVWLAAVLETTTPVDHVNLLVAAESLVADSVVATTVEDLARFARDESVRTQALNVLSRVPDFPRVWDVIRHARNDPAKMVREQAQELLDRRGQAP